MKYKSKVKFNTESKAKRKYESTARRHGYCINCGQEVDDISKFVRCVQCRIAKRAYYFKVTKPKLVFKRLRLI